MNIFIIFRKGKTLLRLIIGAVKYEFVTRKYKLPPILSIEETINRVIGNKMSIARFGDSEYLYLTGGSDGLQKTNAILKEGLKRAILNRNPNLLISLVDYEKTEEKTWRAKMSAKMFHSRTISGYHYLLDQKYEYGNSNMTRFYIGRKDKTDSHRLFKKCKKLWENRDIIIFEGQLTRFGYGNDLFDNCLSIKRVLCPCKGAFEFYDKILAFAKTLPKESLLIFALGASATIAAADLTDSGYQVIDIGNLDIEYEWFLRGAKSVVKIENKQVSEVVNGTNVNDLTDETYIKQIIEKIGI